MFKATHKDTGLVLAIKKVSLSSKQHKEEIQKEIEILKKLRNSYIVSYFGSCSVGNELWVINQSLTYFSDSNGSN